MKKSILFIDQFREVTGGQIVLQSLIRVAREAGYETGVLAPMGGGLEAALEASWSGSVARHDLRELSLQSGRKGWRDVWNLLAFSLYMLRFLRLVSGYGLVYVNGGRLALPCAFLSLLTRRTRWIYHVHLCHSGLEKRLLGAIARLPRTARMVLASQFILEDFVRSRPAIARNPKVCVVENCLNAPYDTLPFVDRFGTPGTPLTVALIGRVSSVKGHDVLPRLARALPEVRFVFIGRTAPDQLRLLQSLLDGAPPNLVYAGESTNLPETIECLGVQVSIVPSRWEEPFGLVSIESMAMSCLTLVSDRGMLPHIAAATGAWCFHDDDELTGMLTTLHTAPRDRWRETAFRQHFAALRRYGFEDFRRRTLEVLAPEDAAPANAAPETSGFGMKPSAREPAYPASSSSS